MSFKKKKTPDLGRISIYNLNIDDIELSSSEIQFKKKHTDYDEKHLKRFKYLFKQITGPEKNTLDIKHFESAVRSMCHSLRESNEVHHFTEILFKAYDKNTKWTVIDAPHEEQIGGLHQAFQESNRKLSKNRLIEFLTILKEDFQRENYYQNQDQFKSLKTDDNIRNRVNGMF